MTMGWPRIKGGLASKRTWPLWLEQLPGGPADTGPHPSAAVLLPGLPQLWVLTKSRGPPNGQG